MLREIILAAWINNLIDKLIADKEAELLRRSTPAVVEIVEEEEQSVIEVVEEPHLSSYSLTEEERSILEQIVACEAGADVFEGQVAVALCMKNYCDLRNVSVMEMISALQISTYPRKVTEENKAAVSQVWDIGTDLPTYEPIMYWCTPAAAANGAWHETQVFVGQFGAHRFYRTR